LKNGRGGGAKSADGAGTNPVGLYHESVQCPELTTDVVADYYREVGGWLGLGRKFSLSFFRESFREIDFSFSRKILYKKTKLSRKSDFAKTQGEKSLNGQ
jgi:hypothetical protein